MITIIVLLILAGVTIAQLTGTDSAPAKANEAKQKNDIGAAKDQVYLFASNAQTEAYEIVYVKGKKTDNSGEDVSAGDASSQVGAYVRTQVYEEYKVEKNKKVGLASIVATEDGQITISTTDVTETGEIAALGGALSWNGITTGGSGGGTSGNAKTVQELAQSGAIQRWDRINYNPGNGTTASINLPDGAKIEGTKLASLNLPAGASLDGTINASDASNWVVLDVNETTGEVLIIPTTVSHTLLGLSGKDGYNNAIQALNAVAGVYLNPAYATSARSLTAEDFFEVENYTPNGKVAGPFTWNHRYGIDDNNLNIIDAGEGNAPSRTYASTQTTGVFDNYNIENFNIERQCWLASRRIDVTSNECTFEVLLLSGSRIYCGFGGMLGLWTNGTESTSGGNMAVIPVVTLKPEIKLEKVQREIEVEREKEVEVETPGGVEYQYVTVTETEVEEEWEIK